MKKNSTYFNVFIYIVPTYYLKWIILTEFSNLGAVIIVRNSFISIHYKQDATSEQTES